MSENCAICRDSLPVEKPLLRRSSRLRGSEDVNEENPNLFLVNCCGQSFHATCFLQCLQTSTRCPLCCADFIPLPEPQIIPISTKRLHPHEGLIG